MRYLASSESAGVGEAITFAHRGIDPLIAEAITASTLQTINGSLIYVPIVMPIEMHERYKERSRYVQRARTYECCPRLNHQIFLRGDPEDIVVEYLRGLALAAPHLHRLGASDAQAAEFLSALTQVGSRALLERRDVTRQ